jgi:hypothetical protein
MRKIFTFRNSTILFSTLLLLIIFSSCAKKEVVDACLTGQQFGFWGGLWHGIIAPIDFIVSLFNKDITIYATNNNGAWYALGFLVGSGGWGFLGGKGAAKNKKDNC